MTPQDRQNAAGITTSANLLAEQLLAVMTASAAVIEGRVRIGMRAFCQPELSAALEADTMLREKAVALVSSYAAAAQSSAAIGAQSASYLIAESEEFGRLMLELAGSRTHQDAGAIEANAFMDGWGRVMSHWLAIGAASTAMRTAALEPYLKASAANALRLATPAVQA